MGVGLAAIAAAVFGHVLDVDSTAEKAISLFSALAYMIAPLVIIRHLIRRQIVDLRTVLGAVAIYLLLGMMFAFTFRAIALNGGGAFFGETGEGTNANFLFFSFITLTTTGYGNLVPAETRPIRRRAGGDCRATVPGHSSCQDRQCLAYAGPRNKPATDPPA